VTLLVVGDGPVARALATALARSGAPPARWWRGHPQGGAPSPADVVVLAVRDAAIGDAAATVVRQFAARQIAAPVLLHCAGAVPSAEAFAQLDPAPRGRGLVHPLRAFAGGPDDAALAGTVFAVEGDPAGRAAAVELVARLGGKPLFLEAAELARYHAAAALVSNHSVGLVDAAVELLGGLGLPRPAATAALAALLASTARNLEAVGLPAALTGPIARGDVAVVARHLDALADAPALAALYRATARRVTDVAAQKGAASADALVRIRGLVDGK
jgi:predicted short-subunit dehydrogenase-like oxidoreductase (DUF2520 family)